MILKVLKSVQEYHKPENPHHAESSKPTCNVNHIAGSNTTQGQN